MNLPLEWTDLRPPISSNISSVSVPKTCALLGGQEKCENSFFIWRFWRLSALWVWLIGAASCAEQICGASVHSRFGETRAYFRDVLTACRPDNYCSAVIALATDGGAAYRQQLRIARPAPDAPYVVELVGVDPMPAGDGAPMSLQFGATKIDLVSAPTSPGTNEFRVSDHAMADDLVARMRLGRVARWTYQTAAGPAQAEFPLNGVKAALDWLDCMQAQ